METKQQLGLDAPQHPSIELDKWTITAEEIKRLPLSDQTASALAAFVSAVVAERALYSSFLQRFGQEASDLPYAPEIFDLSRTLRELALNHLEMSLYEHLDGPVTITEL